MRNAALIFAAAILALPVNSYAAAPAPTSVPVASEASPTSKTFSEAEKAAVEDVIKEYLTVKHPEVLMEAMRELQKREQASAESKTKEAVNTSKDKIFNDPTSPVGGNPKGDVTVVEFFDYQCGYCKLSEEAIEKLIKEDKNVKVIYKEFPILGPMSVTISKAALASVKQGKYQKFHDALMKKKDKLSEDGLYQVAKENGIDVEKLKKDMGTDEMNALIASNIKLGSEVGVRGTPMFIINEQVYPGALQYEQLKQAVDDARAAAKKN
ncbi:MAG: DsbA family protein [Alphaproteobacteria bacterium]